MSSLRPIELHLLTALLDGPCHGYGLVERVDALTAGRRPVRAGDLYRVIARLERQGLLEMLEATDTSDGERRTDYRLTDLGRERLRAEARVLRRVVGRILDGEIPA